MRRKAAWAAYRAHEYQAGEAATIAAIARVVGVSMDAAKAWPLKRPTKRR